MAKVMPMKVRVSYKKLGRVSSLFTRRGFRGDGAIIVEIEFSEIFIYNLSKAIILI